MPVVMSGTDTARFLRSFRRGPGCWEWTATQHDSDGYGSSFCGGRRLLAHRVAWTLANGPIPDGLHVLHRCDNPRCVNPAHLFLGTQADNNRDLAQKGRHGRPNAKRTGCRWGHPFTPENTWIDKQGGRHCIECKRRACRSHYARNRARMRGASRERYAKTKAARAA